MGEQSNMKRNVFAILFIALGMIFSEMITPDVEKEEIRIICHGSTVSIIPGVHDCARTLDQVAEWNHCDCTIPINKWAEIYYWIH